MASDSEYGNQVFVKEYDQESYEEESHEEECEEDSEADEMTNLKEKIMRLMFDHGMAIFGSTAREMVRIADNGMCSGVPGQSDIDAFFLDKPIEKSKHYPDAHFDLDKTERWAFFVRDLESKGIFLDGQASMLEESYAMDMRVYKHMAKGYGQEVALDIISADLSTHKKVVFDADVNAFALTRFKPDGSIKWIYMGPDSRASALDNLSKGRFKFFLNESNTVLDGSNQSYHLKGEALEFYKSVMRSHRYCKLRNACFRTKSITVPVHDTARRRNTCILCAKSLNGKVWSCFNCETQTHHLCTMRLMRASAAVLRRVQYDQTSKAAASCPVCKESPL